MNREPAPVGARILVLGASRRWPGLMVFLLCFLALEGAGQTPYWKMIIVTSSTVGLSWNLDMSFSTHWSSMWKVGLLRKCLSCENWLTQEAAFFSLLFSLALLLHSLILQCFNPCPFFFLTSICSFLQAHNPSTKIPQAFKASKYSKDYITKNALTRAINQGPWQQ